MLGNKEQPLSWWSSMSIEILAGNGVWVSVGGGLRYVFTGSLLGTTILDGGMRERSDV